MSVATTLMFLVQREQLSAARPWGAPFECVPQNSDPSLRFLVHCLLSARFALHRFWVGTEFCTRLRFVKSSLLKLRRGYSYTYSRSSLSLGLELSSNCSSITFERTASLNVVQYVSVSVFSFLSSVLIVLWRLGVEEIVKKVVWIMVLDVSADKLNRFVYFAKNIFVCAGTNFDESLFD